MHFIVSEEIGKGGGIGSTREFKLPKREAGPPNYLDDEVDSDQCVVNKELTLSVADSDQ